jgi:glutathione-regulated potassium-efflux system ancillary protein KefG
MNKILVIYAHPEAPRSRANRVLRRGAQALLAEQDLTVTWHDLYENYPDFHVDVQKEQELLLGHDVLVFQHPFYWYSVPALLKQWIDEVLEDGWAYGGGARQLANKGWAHWVTAGGSANAYTALGQNHFEVEQLMRPLEQTALLCQCHWIAPQFTFSSLTLDEPDLQAQAERYAAWLKTLALTPSLASAAAQPPDLEAPMGGRGSKPSNGEAGHA